MRPQKLATLILCGATVFCTYSNAQLNVWERVHPDGPDNNLGGSINDLSSSADGVVYLRSRFDRHYSRANSSEAWENYTPRRQDSQPINVSNYFPHPTIAGQITANRSNGTVVRSVNYGRTWTELSELISTSLIARSTSNPENFYAAGFGDNFFSSTDGGVTWNAIPLSDFNFIADLEIDPTNENILYALDGQRIKKSLDGGFNWQVMDQGTGNLWFMNDLAIDPANPLKLLAASGNSTHVFRTNDGAMNWKFIGIPDLPGTGFPFNAIKFDPSDSSNVYAVGSRASVHVSNDGGSSWTQHTDGMGNTDWNRLTISNAGDVVIGGVSGVAVLPSPGVLEFSNQGFSDFRMQIIARDSIDQRYWYAGSTSGLTVYDAVNDKWSIPPRPFDNSVRGIAVYPNSSERVIVASFYEGLSESSDAGQTWQQIPLPDDGTFGLGIAIAPSDSNVLYVRTEDGLSRSNDGGSSWQLILDSAPFNAVGPKYPIKISPINPDIVHVGSNTSGVYTTQDGGQSWTNTEDFFPQNTIAAIDIDPRNLEHVYATLYNGYLMRSLDSGATWKEFDLSGTSGFPRTLALDPRVPGRILLVTTNGLFIYEPFFQEWSAEGIGQIPTCGLIACDILLDPIRQGLITVSADGELFSLQLDYDSDQLGDDVDNCTLISNPAQRDTDSDGYGNYCDPDFNNDLVVNFLDVVELANAYLGADPNIDMDGDGVVNFVDLSLLQDYFLSSPGPGANGSP